MKSPTQQTESPLEIIRRLESLLRIGTVSEVRHSDARCRVKTGTMHTDWLPWLTLRAGQDRTWWAPEPDEQVIVLSPGGDTRAGFVLPAGYSEKKPAPGKSAEVARMSFADGTVIEYDRAVNVLRVRGPQLIKLEATSQVLLAGDVYIDGNLHVNGSIRANGSVMGAGGVWPPRPLMVPGMARSGADGGIHP